MLALARQGSSTRRNVDRWRNRLDRSHGVGSGDSSKESSRERGVFLRARELTMEEQQCRRNGITQQWMNKGITHCCLFATGEQFAQRKRESFAVVRLFDYCGSVVFCFCACASCENNGGGTCQDQAFPSCLCRPCRLVLQIGRDFCRGQAVNMQNAWVLCRRWFRLSQPV